MKFLISIFVSLFFFISCSQDKEVELKLLVKVNSVKKVAIATPYDYFEIPLDEFDMASTSVSIKEACFATILCDGAGMEVFLSPDKSLSVEINSIDGKLDFKLDCDDGGINDYLIEDLKNNKLMKYSDFYDEESKFITKLDSLLVKELDFADTLQFSDDFKRLNAKRIKFNVLSPLGIYPQYHSYVTKNEDYLPSQGFFDFVDKYKTEDASLFGLSSYIAFMDNMAVCAANRYIKDWDSQEFTTNSLSYLVDSVKNVKLKEILISKRVEAYLREKGLKESEEILDVANKFVVKPIYKNNIDSLVVGWERIEKGNKSYPFKFKNTNSDIVNLDSLAGKYILICVGATWCFPCKDEIKAFDLLVDKYKDVQFVNLSIDNDFSNWKRYINRQNHKAIQLNISSDQGFLESYMVYTIPRFILLDKRGKIIEARMPTASNVKFKDVLEGLH